MKVAGLQAVSHALWEERHQAELLLARVVALRLVLQAGEHRFVSACLDEVETAMAELAGHTLAREEVLADVAPTPSTLATLAATAPPPLAWALAEHDSSLTGLVDELDLEVSTTRRLARAAREQAMDALSLARAQPVQGPDGLTTTMELELRAQVCRNVLVVLREPAPGLRAFLTRSDQGR